jgi:alginate O-acetyltransferase complex protein AlgI
MLFNSSTYAIFLSSVFVIHWLKPEGTKSYQNMLLLISSYFFYGFWDVRFLFLLIFSTLLDYYSGLQIFRHNSNLTKKAWLAGSITINLCFLCVFKYFNFFVASATEVLNSLGVKSNGYVLNIILPVGISFYTFHGISYVIDVYRKKIEPTVSIVDYSLFVSFFPLLVAGPIERAGHLLPQLKKPRRFEYSKAVDGIRQILWGLFKKITIADNCAEYANMVFTSPTSYSGSDLFAGAVLFAFQIYCDFSGYSDIALGTAKLFGLDLLQNFRYPYFSRDIAEFWRRWHISLSSWFKDYVYIPLGGSKGTTMIMVRNTIIIFILSGIWHGASWTFVVWGALNALYFIPLLLFGKNRKNLDIVGKGALFPTFKELTMILLTFTLTVFAWIFFRAETIHDALGFTQGIFTLSFLSWPTVAPTSLVILISAFIIIEWIGRENEHPLATLAMRWPRPMRWSLYYAMVMLTFFFSGKQQSFIYFQF